ncbi:MAG: hypothetical protein WA996_11295 [Candidatus Promineifilaceae bacterium]
MASITEGGNREAPLGSRQKPGKPGVVRAETSVTDEHIDDNDSTGLGGERTEQVEESRPQKVDDVSTDSSDSSIPGWLLDIDAALKASRTSEQYDSDAGSVGGIDAAQRGADQSGVGGLHDEPVRRLDTSDLPEQPKDSTETLDWVSALDRRIKKSDSGIGEDDQIQSQTGSKSMDQGIEHTGDAALDRGQILRRSHMGTQPLDTEGKLLGVPTQLAGTDLPSWLRDQLQRPGDIDSEEIAEDIKLPEPPRVTFIKPKGPVIEHQESPVEDPVLDPSFEKWLKQLSEESVSPDWMKKGEEQLDEAVVSDSVQASAETPRWLRDIHEEEGDTAELLGIEESIEDKGRLAGLKGAIHIEPAIATPLVTSLVTDYTISKEQRQQIALLEGLVHAEPVKEKRKTIEWSRGSSLRLRVLLAGALILLILISAAAPASTKWLQGAATQPVSEEAQQLYDQIRKAAGTPVLVAFDYTPAMAGELNPIANILLGQLAEIESQAITVSQSAAGSEVAAIVAQDVDGLDWQQLGYIPGEAIGLRSLAECLNDPGDCQTLFGQPLPDEAQRRLAEVTLILVLTSDSESLTAWIEQVEAQLKNVALVAGVTQALGPLTIPYFISGQLEGVIEGYPDAIAYERNLIGIEGDSTANVSGITLAIWLAAGILLAGTIYYALTGLKLSRPGSAKD